MDGGVLTISTRVLKDVRNIQKSGKTAQMKATVRIAIIISRSYLSNFFLISSTSFSYGRRVGLAVLKGEGLVNFGFQEFEEEVPVKTKRLTYGLTEKGRQLIELHTTLSKTGNADLLQITPRQLECLNALVEDRRTFKDIPRAEYTVLNGLIRRGLIDKLVVEMDETRRLQQRKPVYTLTEKGAKAYEAYRVIESL